MHKTISLALALAGCVPALAAVPIRWTVDTSRAQPAQFDAYRGETLDLAAAFQSYGRPLAVTGPAALYYQTNGMGTAWWTAPATVSSNTISATFGPSVDPGASVLNCFLGGTASTYRAAFRLRLLNSPGAAPNTIQPPVQTLDLAAVTILNAPWPTEDAVDDKDAQTLAAANAYTDARAGVPSQITDGTNTISADLSVEIPGDYTDEWDVVTDPPGFEDRVHVVWSELAFGTGWAVNIDTTPDVASEDPYATSISGNAYSLEIGQYVRVIATRRRAVARTRLATTNEVVTGVETNMTLAGFDGAMNTMVVRPPAPTAAIPGNQWRIMKLGDDRTVAYSQFGQADKLLVSAPSNLYFVAGVDASGGVASYTLVSFKDYLDAASPSAVAQLLGGYLPTNGGGRVTGVLDVDGDLSVSGTFEGPGMIRIRSSDIEANGFTVSNGVVRANSGLVVSNGMCTINCARALNGIGTSRLHVEGGPGDVTFGGTWDSPDSRLPDVVTNLVDSWIGTDGTSVSDNLGPFRGEMNRVARIRDFATFGCVNAATPTGENHGSATRGMIHLRNGCVNVPTTSLSKTSSLTIYFPYSDPSGSWDMTQNSSFGIYFSSAPAAATVAWDYAPEDGGWNLVGETGDELAITAGDLLWFQQVGTNTLSVTKKNYAHALNPTRAE